VPPDIAAAGARRGNGDAGLDGDLAGAGSGADLDGLSRVDQSGLDLLAAGHDRSADGDPPGDDQRFGQARRLCGAGPGAAKPGPGLGRAGDLA